MPENSMHKCTNTVNNVQPIRNLSHMAKILSVYNRLQAGDYKNGNGGKRRVSRLTQFMHATLQLFIAGDLLSSSSCSNMWCCVCWHFYNSLSSWICMSCVASWLDQKIVKGYWTCTKMLFKTVVPSPFICRVIK